MRNNDSLSNSILLVDDDPSLLKSLRAVLITAGYNEIVLCDNGRQVPQIIQKKTPAVAIIDLKMPGLSGMELLKLFQSHCPETPVIILSATPDGEAALTCLRNGAFDYLEKPVETAKIIATLQKALNYYLLSWENRNLRKMLFFDPPLSRQERILHFINDSSLYMAPLLLIGTRESAVDLSTHIHQSSAERGTLRSIEASDLNNLDSLRDVMTQPGTLVIYNISRLADDIQNELFQKISSTPLQNRIRILAHTTEQAEPIDHTELSRLLWNRRIMVPILQELEPIFPTLREMTETLIRQAMEQSGGNQRAAAEKLGISQQALSKRLKRHSELTTFVHK